MTTPTKLCAQSEDSDQGSDQSSLGTLWVNKHLKFFMWIAKIVHSHVLIEGGQLVLLEELLLRTMWTKCG